jgi:hypothetical protein
MSVNNAMATNLPLNCLYKVFIRPFPHIKLTPVTTKGISEIIKSLKCTNSHGYDEIPIGILKISLPFIISPLTYTGCPRRNVPDFGRVFLMLMYTDITQNTYIQS